MSNERYFIIIDDQLSELVELCDAIYESVSGIGGMSLFLIPDEDEISPPQVQSVRNVIKNRAELHSGYTTDSPTEDFSCHDRYTFDRYPDRLIERVFDYAEHIPANGLIVVIVDWRIESLHSNVLEEKGWERQTVGEHLIKEIRGRIMRQQKSGQIKATVIYGLASRAPNLERRVLDLPGTQLLPKDPKPVFANRLNSLIRSGIANSKDNIDQNSLNTERMNLGFGGATFSNVPSTIGIPMLIILFMIVVIATLYKLLS